MAWTDWTRLGYVAKQGVSVQRQFRLATRRDRAATAGYATRLALFSTLARRLLSRVLVVAHLEHREAFDDEVARERGLDLIDAAGTIAIDGNAIHSAGRLLHNSDSHSSDFMLAETVKAREDDHFQTPAVHLSNTCSCLCQRSTKRIERLVLHSPVGWDM
jgi:hypothetical protein